MATNVVGEIYDPRKQLSIEWKIKNYFSLSQKADSFIVSPTFYCFNAHWFLKLFPNGERETKSVEYLSLYMMNENSVAEEISMNCVLGIRSGDGKTFKQRSYNYTTTKGHMGCGDFFFLKRSELLRNRDIIAPNGNITVFFVLKQTPDVRDASSQTASVDGARCLSRDFFSLLQSNQKSDVVIKLKRREFQAHKLILGARSSVFAAMFKYDMKENTSGVVNMEDCDSDSFQEFLLFMYTGQIKELASENVFTLFALADKYDISDLKEICIDFMKDNLTLDIACNVLSVADTHNEVELKKSAKELIVSNMKALFQTQQWITFLRDNPNLATELLMTVIPDKLPV